MSLCSRTSILVLFLVSSGPVVSAQGDPQDSGLSREEMWRAPTAEDWSKPCLIEWQRNWEDAERLSRESGRPILVCVNMDGEIASEHYAGIRYRQPEVAELFAPYVCVIASVYRHTERDFDSAGNRILCPRFGGVTCGEHIAIEPTLYEKYFDGDRVAPRHVMVELDGSETYDVYYAFDTASVFREVRRGIEERAIRPRDLTDGERSTEDLVASPDARDREAVERAYRTGTHAERRRILEAAVAAGDRASADLLRLAIFGFDVDLARLGRKGLARTNEAGAVGLLNDALRVAMPNEEREALIGALERLGKRVPWARTLAVVHRGLGERSQAVDASGWAGKGAVGPAEPEPDREELAAQLAYSDSVEDVGRLSPEAALELAQASFRLARSKDMAAGLGKDAKTRRAFENLLFEDARRATARARECGAGGWPVEALEVLTTYALGEGEQAFQLAEQAMADLPPGDTGWNSMAVVSIFAEARRAAITRAQAAGEDWPSAWLSDVNAAYGILSHHPEGTAEQVARQVDFLLSLGAFGPARAALEGGLARFPVSAELHARYRARLLREGGSGSLEAAYERLLAAKGAPPSLGWYAGYASLVAAEFHRRAGEGEAALVSYGRGKAYFEACLAAGAAEARRVDHFVAMALAGEARVAFEAGDLEGSMAKLEASFARRPEAAASPDGLNLTAVGTAKLLRSVALRRGRGDIVERVDAALAGLDPRLLELPAFERGGPPLPGSAGAAGSGGAGGPPAR